MHSMIENVEVGLGHISRSKDVFGDQEFKQRLGIKRGAPFMAMLQQHFSDLHTVHHLISHSVSKHLRHSPQCFILHLPQTHKSIARYGRERERGRDTMEEDEERIRGFCGTGFDRLCRCLRRMAMD